MSEYLTFPVIILKDGIKDIKLVTNDAMFYCLYDYCQGKKGTQAALIQEAEKELGINYGNKKAAYSRGEILYNSIPERSPKTSIRKEIIFDFYKEYKTEFEIITFLAFAALRSILQKQPYIKTTNDILIRRMAGNLKKEDPLPEEFIKYNKEYWLKKIKLELQTVSNNLHKGWGLKLYACHTRGFYVTFRMSREELIMQAELRRKKYKEKELKRENEEARKAALNKIYETSH